MSVSLGQETKVSNIVCNTIYGATPLVAGASGGIANASTTVGGIVTLATQIDNSSNAGKKVPTGAQIVAYVGANAGSGGSTSTSTSTNFGTDATAITSSTAVAMGNINSLSTVVVGGNTAIVSSASGVVAINNSSSTSGLTKINNTIGYGGVIIGNSSTTVSLLGTVTVNGNSITLPTLATVATSGIYSDLTNTPSVIDSSKFSATITAVGTNFITVSSTTVGSNTIANGTQIIFTAGGANFPTLLSLNVFVVGGVSGNKLSIAYIPSGAIITGMTVKSGLTIMSVLCYSGLTTAFLSTTSVPSTNALLNIAGGLGATIANQALTATRGSVSAASTTSAGIVTLATAVDNVANASNIPTCSQLI